MAYSVERATEKATKPAGFSWQSGVWSRIRSAFSPKKPPFRKARRHPLEEAMLFEALEPRVLLSADLSYSAMADGDFTLRVAEIDGIQTLQLAESQSPSVVVAWESLSNIHGARIDAGGFDVNLRIDASVEAAGVAGGIVFVGGEGDNTLFGSGNDSTWNITGAGEGTLGDVRFSGVENLIGSADNEDTFVFEAAGSISGVIDGGVGGFDSLVMNSNSEQTVDYRPSATNETAGVINVNGIYAVNFTGLEPIDIIGAGTASINLLGADDVLTIANGTGAGGAALVVSGTSGGVAFEQVRFRNNSTVNIDTNVINNGTADIVTIASANNAHGNVNLNINTGPGGGATERVDITGASIFSGNVSITSARINSNATLTAGATGNVTLTANVAGITDANGVTVNITAAGLVATATTGISLDTTVSNLEASGGTGGVNIQESNALVIGGITGPLAGVSATGGNITIKVKGNLTVNEDVVNSGGGAITLEGASGPTTATVSSIPNVNASYNGTVADFNRDGWLDYAVANIGNGTVSVFFNNQAGGFFTPLVLSGIGTYDVEAVDVNSDGAPDLAGVNFSGSVRVSLNNGAGGFLPSTTINAGIAGYTVDSGDFNGDGKGDIVVGRDNVSVLINNGVGGFNAPIVLSAANSFVHHVTTADINRDGRLDIVASVAGSSQVQVFAGNGAGGFSTYGIFNSGVGGQVRYSAVGDLNGDGFLDIVAANRATDRIGILLGNGVGFSAVVEMSSGGSAPYSVAVGDVNGDSFSDIVVGNQISNQLRVFHGDGTGTYNFVDSVTFSASGPHEIILADFNRDELLDFFQSNASGSAITVTTNTTSGSDLTLNANVTAAGGNGNVTLNAASNILQNGGTVSAAGSGALDYNASTASMNGVITMASGTTASSGSGLVAMDAKGSISLASVSTTGNVLLTATIGAILDNNAAGNNIAAAATVLQTPVGVGTAGNAVETAVTNLEASGGTGGVNVVNTGNLTIGGIGATIGVSATGGDITVTANGNLTVNEEVVNSGGGDVVLSALLVENTITVGGSTLLSQTDLNQLATWLGEGALTLTNIFTKTAVNGMTSADFHTAADGMGRTFSVMEVLATNGNPHDIIGGYNPLSWNSTNSYNITENDAQRTAFIFNLDTMDMRPQKGTAVDASFYGQYQTYNTPSYGPTFGGGHDIYVNNTLSAGYSYKYSYGTSGFNSPNIVGLAYNGLSMQYGTIEVFTIANGGSSSPGDLTFNAAVTATGAATLTAAGAVSSTTLGVITSAAGVEVTNGADGRLAGVIAGAGGFAYHGSAVQTLAAVNTYAGATTINAGSLRVNGSTATGSAVTVKSAATLAGTGTVGGTVAVQSSGAVAPGTSPGILDSGSVTFSSGSNFNVEVNGNVAGTDYDQLNVTGTVNLGGATLNASGTISAPSDESIVLINNDGSDGVTDTFAGLPEGSTVTINGINFMISYAGGTGNDVVLRSVVEVNLSVSAATGTEAGTTAITVTATAADAVFGNQTVALAVLGTNITASDYVLSNSTVTILSGQTAGSVTFTVKDDLLNEGSEIATLSISNPSLGLTLGTITTQNITLTDDDNAGTSNYGLPVAGAYRIVRNDTMIELYDSSYLVASRPLGIDPVVIRGTSGNDTLTVDFIGGSFMVPITFSGGLQVGAPGDTLAITGGNQGTVTYNYINANDGSVVMSNLGTVNYTGLSPIINTGTGANVVFNLPASGNVQAILEDDGIGGNGLSTFRSSPTAFESTTFSNPTGSLTINRGSATDDLTVNALPDLTASLNIGTSVNPLDQLLFNGMVTLAANKSLNAYATGDANLSGTAALTLSGVGVLDIEADRDANGIGNYVQAAGATVNVGTFFLIKAADFVLDGTIVSTNSNGHIAPSSAGATIGVGGSGSFNISDAELDRIIMNPSYALLIGDSTVTGNANVSTTEAISLTTLGIEVRTGGGIAVGNFNLSSENYLALSADADANGTGAITTGAGLVSANQLYLAAAQGITLSINAGVLSANNRTTGDISLTESDGVTIGSFGLKTLAGNGNINLNTAGGISVLAAVSAHGSGNVTLTAGANSFVSATQSISSTSGTIQISAGDGVSLATALADVTTSGTVTIDADSESDDDGTFSVTDAGAAVSGSSIEIAAADVNLVGTLSSAGTVTVQPAHAGRQIDLGTNTAGQFGLTDAELDRISASVLRVGSSTAGNVVVSAPISPFGTDTLHLVTTGSVTVSGGGSVSEGSLAVEAGGLVSLTGSQVGTVAITTATNNVQLSDLDGLIVGSVDGVFGISALNGGVGLSVLSGNLRITDTAAANDVFGKVFVTFDLLADDALAMIEAGADVETVLSGSVVFLADKLQLSGTVSAAGSTVTLLSRETGDKVDLGSTTDAAADTLELSDAELDRISAGTINIGGNNSGAITFTANITRAVDTNINLTTGSGNSIAFGAFSLNAGTGGDVSLTASGSGAITTGNNTGTDLTADDVAVNAGLGGIGSTTHFLRLAATTITGATTGNGDINLVEVDSVTIVASNGLDAGMGTITFGGGTFIVTGSSATASPVILQSTATLGGTGTVGGTVTLKSGATVAPGLSPGILNSGSVTFNNGSNFNVEVNGYVAGTDYDQLNVTGTVSLGDAPGGATLYASGTISSRSDQPIVLIDNDDADPVIGTFSGLPEGSVITINGIGFTISYSGGSGNDVVLRSVVPVNLSVSAAAGTEAGTTAITVTATADGAVAGNQTVNLGVSGTNITAGDYTLSNGTITILSGRTVGAVTFTVSDDTFVEGAEMATLTISNPSAGLILGSTTTRHIAITDNESATLAIASGSSVTESGSSQPVGVVTLTITGTGMGTYALGSGISLTANVTDAGGGTASSGTDYTAFGTQTVTFDAGAVSGATRSTTLTVTEDTIVETDETVILSLGDLGGSAVVKALGNTTNVTTIQNNDKASLSVNDISVTESGTYTFTINSDKVASHAMTVVVNTADGTATLAGADYTALSNVLATIAAGTTSTTVSVTVNNDAIVETNETFVLNLSNAKFNGLTDTSRVVIGDSQGTATILNNDTASLTVNDISLTESGTFTFTISSDKVASHDMTVLVNTADGTGTLAGADYTALTGVLAIIAAGTTSTTVTAVVNNDAIVETNETFTLNLTDAKFNGMTDASRVTIGDPQGTATILNNDTATLAIDSQTITEGDSGSQTMTFTVTSPLAVQGGFTLAFSPTNITTASGDYSVTTASPLSFTGTAGEAKTISVAINGDTTVEPNETFRITLGAVGGTTTVQAAAIASGAIGTGTIIDNDTVTTVGAASVQYSDKVQLSATITTGVASNLTGTVYFSILVGSTWTQYASASATNLPTTGTGPYTATVMAETSQILLAPGNYTYKAEFVSSGSSYSGSAGTGTLTVAKENALAIYVGPTYVSTPNATTSTAVVPLQASIVDTPDGFRGNVDNEDTTNTLTNARVTFMVYDASTNALLATITNVPVNLINPADPTVGSALSNWTANIGSADAVTYRVRTIVNNYYTQDSVLDDELVTVAKPLDNSITGGGYIINTDSAGRYAADDGLKTNLGFNAKFNNAGTNPQGKINIIFRRMEADGKVHVYQIKSTAISSLGVNAADGTATFLSKANLTDVTNPLSPISLGGNLDLTVRTDDNGAPGTGSNNKGNDKVSVTLFRGSELWFSSNWTGVQSQLQVLDGGNIRNHPNTERLLYFVNSAGDAPGDLILTEGNSGTQNMVFTVKLSQASTQTVTANYSTADNSPTAGAATAGQDYVAKSGTLSFAPGETSKQISISINADVLPESDESFFIYLANPVGAGIQDSTAIGVIVNDDFNAAPVLAPIGNRSINEGATLNIAAVASDTDGPLNALTFSLDAGAPTGALIDAINGNISWTPTEADGPGTYSFTVRVTDNGTPSLSDFETILVTVNEVNLAPELEPISDQLARIGQLLSFTAHAQDEDIPANNLTFSLEGAVPVGATIDPATGQFRWTPTSVQVGTHSFGVVVTDNGVLPLTDRETLIVRAGLDFSISDAVISEGFPEQFPVVVVQVSLPFASSEDVRVDFATVEGTAKAGVDYVAAGGTLIFSPGQTSRQIGVQIIGDVLLEPNENFFIDLSNPVNATIGDGRGVITVANDGDTFPLPSVVISSASLTEGNGGPSNMVFTVTRQGQQLGQPGRVDYATVNGTAVAGEDYVATSGTLLFAANETTKLIVVAINGDLVAEPNEFFSVQLSNPANVTIQSGVGQGTIVDDDRPRLSIDDVSLAEGDAGTTDAVFTVSLVNPLTQTVTVNFATANGSAQAGIDYVAASGTLTFLAGGAASQTISVVINGDTVFEPNETFFIFLTSATNAVIADAQGVGTIINDEIVGAFSIADASLVEGNAGTTGMLFTVRREGALADQSSTVSFNTVNGTATAGSDYATTSGTLTFGPGETIKQFFVPVHGDLLVEGNETFLVNLSNATNATIADAQAIGTIVNDDGSPMLAETTGFANGNGDKINQSIGNAVVIATIKKWAELLGDGNARLDALGEVGIVIADLDGVALGFTVGNTIMIDIDAAGHGWFVDASPWESSEFLARIDENTYDALKPSEAFGRMDLLTVVAHELGHILGLSHEDADRFAVMREELNSGTRYVLGNEDENVMLGARPGLPGAIGSSSAIPANAPAAAPFTPDAAWKPWSTRSALQQSSALAPLIDWKSKPVGDDKSAEEETPQTWIADFLNHAGQSEAQRNPNAGLRIHVPVAGKIAAEVSQL
jgi:Calx-beta domain/FG-GAP-like repeat/Bacterial Ig domain/TLD